MAQMETPLMETTVYGKWILAGEHAVLRGSPALVFPVFSHSLDLKYGASESGLSVEFGGEHGAELRLLFWGVVEKALELTGHSRSEMSGRFQIVSNIPVGAGLGASAALSVGIGRWFVWRGWVNSDNLPEFCRQLENLFHGESSGVDIAVALSRQGLHFERNGVRETLEPQWCPNWYISYSGKRGVTSECIAKVKDLWNQDRALGEQIDHKMKQAVFLAEQALLSASEEAGFEQLMGAINSAHSCFENWGLASGECGAHVAALRGQGASAVKPTGSGDGGFVLSLWRQAPSSDQIQKLGLFPVGKKNQVVVV
jgi:mevalonate kinase